MEGLLRVRGLAAALVVAAALSAASPAQAQYFGRNKVQYKDFDFEVLKTDHFDVYFYPEEREAAGEVARMAERWRARLTTILQHDLTSPQPIVLYASHPDFQQTNVVQGAIGEGTGGVTEGLKRRVVLPIAASLAETDHVLGHELVHAFQYDMASRRADRGEAALMRLPLWFIEGMAEYLSIGHADPHTAMWIRDAARDGKLPSIRRLGHAEYFPYRWGQALWAYVAGRFGDDVVGTALDEALQSGSPEDALERATGVSEKELSAQWHEAVQAQYGSILASAARAHAHGRVLTASEGSRRSLAVSPALSPDARRIVYLSERDLLSIDLFLADADTGQVIRKLVNTAVDPHYTSLQFIGSAGSWHPTGRQFAFAAIKDGQPTLAIADTERGGIVREVPFAALGEILNPSWSPDGRRIVFSALAGGRSDLFIYDLESEALRQVTHDAFADLQPAWSPDGRRVAFVTDRFSTDLSTLHAGRYGLALLDPDSGEIEAVPTFDRGKSINPQWAPDGRHLYFLSDRSGITNVYVIELAERQVRQVTDVDAGASGITALSPALSVPLDARRLAFSAYDEGHIRIYIMEGAEALAGMPVREIEHTHAGVLPPVERATDTLATLLSDPLTGLPPDAGRVEPYRSRLSLDAVGQPSVMVGTSPFGTLFGGGLSFFLSDMLGNHNLVAAFGAQTSGSGFRDILKNTEGVVAYQNLKNRWNWGVAVEQVPYLAGGFASGIATVNGQAARVDQAILYRQTFRGASGAVAYPFSGAQRLELGGGYQQVSFEQQVRTVTTSRTGRILDDRTETTSLGPTLNLGTATAALVFDSSTFGATSPVAGQRSRLQITPTAGSLSFVNALADYRRYFMPARFYTIATRGLHAGRYGPDGEDGRLVPLFLGYPELVRGYGIGSFAATECTASATSTCQEFERLLGSRMVVGNIEFRFPLLRPFGVRHGMYGPVPVEAAFFADGGIAWSSDERVSFGRGVSSAGVTFRVNVFGFAVGQIDLAHPFQRTGRGWVWGFSLTPGF